MPLSRRYFFACAAAAVLPARAADLPRPAPDFSIDLPGGGKLPLKSFRGRIVVLTFISTT